MVHFLHIVILYGLVSLGNCACFTFGYSGPIDGGEMFCEYQGYKFRNGSSFQTPDCLDCECISGGLGCCSFGAAMTHVQGIPSWCEWKIDGCDAKPVMSNDPTLDCVFSEF